MRNPVRLASLLAAAGLLSVVANPCAGAGEAASPGGAKPAPRAIAADGAGANERFMLSDLLPLAWQKRPKLRFNVFTELAPAGRTWRVPTPDQPLRYFAQPAKFVQTGWQPAAGEKPPPGPELEATMRKALAESGYVSIAGDQERPDILVVLTYGSHGTDFGALAPVELSEDLPPPPVTAEELLPYVLRDPSAIRDVINRARFIAGDRFAREMQSAMVGPMADFQFFLMSGDSRTRDLAEMAFHTCYWVMATAYDFRGVEQKQKVPLWQTRMTVEAQGVSLAEVLKPLIVNTGSFLGRETTEPVVVTKRISREGRVEIGEAKVVPDKPAPPAEGKK